eukprot:12453907-Alexandrium_andersonii.AAC.1
MSPIKAIIRFRGGLLRACRWKRAPVEQRRASEQPAEVNATAAGDRRGNCCVCWLVADAQCPNTQNRCKACQGTVQ